MKFKQFGVALLASLLAASAQATAIRLEPVSATVTQGTVFDVRIVADIDAADAIIGFGFDLDASLGILLNGFTAGPGFADDPLYLAPFSDGDGIRGASAGDLLFGPPVSGPNVLLGVLHLGASALGGAVIGLGADDLAFNFTEGLIPLSASLVNFMPPVTAAFVDVLPSANVVAEPSSLACVALALTAMARFGRRRIV